MLSQNLIRIVFHVLMCCALGLTKCTIFDFLPLSRCVNLGLKSFKIYSNSFEVLNKNAE